jgi:hypothetical protein
MKNEHQIHMNRWLVYKKEPQQSPSMVQVMNYHKYNLHGGDELPQLQSPWGW